MWNFCFPFVRMQLPCSCCNLIWVSLPVARREKHYSALPCSRCVHNSHLRPLHRWTEGLSPFLSFALSPGYLSDNTRWMTKMGKVAMTVHLRGRFGHDMNLKLCKNLGQGSLVAWVNLQAATEGTWFLPKEAVLCSGYSSIWNVEGL